MVRRRVWLLFLVVSAGLVISLGRLAWLQVLSPSAGVEAEARERHYYEVTVEPFRGDIRARNGETLAKDRLAFDIAVSYPRFTHRRPRWLSRLFGAADRIELDVSMPEQVLEQAPPEWAERLARAARLPLDEVMERRAQVVARIGRIRERVLRRRPQLRGRRSFRIKEETVAQVVLPDADLETVSRILARPEEYPDLIVVPARRRFYPMGRLACHVIGRMGKSSRDHRPAPPPGLHPPGKEYRLGDEFGLQGVEKQYDWQLRGVRGRRAYRRRRAPAQDELTHESPAVPGHNIVLALDVAAQQRAEEALGAHTGAVVVMNVRNGEVVVCASNPGYDLNLTGSELAELFRQRPGPLLNRAIRDAVAGGSVIKIATAVAALQAGGISPHTTVNCRGGYRVGGLTWRCGSHGRVGLARAIQHSCNTYFCDIARRTRIVKLALWARRVGIGVRTGVDLPWEKPGRYPDPDWRLRTTGEIWRLGNTLNTCIGQGDLQTTPMQVAVMMAAVANGGDVLWPRMVRADQSWSPVRRPRRRLGLPASHLQAIRRGMRLAVTRGTARHISGLAELGAAAKTGTAEARHAHDNFAWFGGFAPHDSPRYAFAVVVHHTPLHGADASGPIARDVLQVLMERGRGLAMVTP